MGTYLAHYIHYKGHYQLFDVCLVYILLLFSFLLESYLTRIEVPSE